MAETTSQRVLITGGAHGIGRGIAMAFASAGGSVGLIGRDEARLAAFTDELGATRAVYRVADVGDREQLQARRERDRRAASTASRCL